MQETLWPTKKENKSFGNCAVVESHFEVIQEQLTRWWSNDVMETWQVLQALKLTLSILLKDCKSKNFAEAFQKLKSSSTLMNVSEKFF